MCAVQMTEFHMHAHCGVSTALVSGSQSFVNLAYESCETNCLLCTEVIGRKTHWKTLRSFCTVCMQPSCKFQHVAYSYHRPTKPNACAGLVWAFNEHWC